MWSLSMYPKQAIMKNFCLIYKNDKSIIKWIKANCKKQKHWRYTNAVMKILQYIRFHVKKYHADCAYKIFHFFKYAHFKYPECLFTNIQKQ